MDYRYIEQLLERYWQCMTTLEEEDILRAFFSQEDIPVALLPYKNLFAYEQNERRNDKLDDGFDEKMLAMIGEPAPVKARTISITQRLRPLFRAAAMVAIVLTLGNAIQVAFNQDTHNEATETAISPQTSTGPSVAMNDTIRVDTLQNAPKSITPNLIK